MHIKNILVSEYFKLSNTKMYDVVMEYVKECNLFKGKSFDINSLTYDEVNTLRALLSNINVNNLVIIYSICYKEYLLSGRIVEFMQSFKYIADQITKLNERETKVLSSKPDVKLIAAGVHNLNKFKSFNTKMELAKMFGKLPSDIGNMKYDDVFLIQYYNVTLNNIKSNIK